MSVSLLFVLSGFLLDYLLLVEKQRFTIINSRFLYIRRILRIIPLYFFILLLAFYLLPQFSWFHVPQWTDNMNDSLVIKPILYFTFFSNIAILFYSPVPFATQVWSVGTEEQFYIALPLLVKKSISPIKLFTRILVIFSILQVISKIDTLIFDIILRNYQQDPNPIYLIKHYFDLLPHLLQVMRFDCLSIGALVASLYFAYTQKVSAFVSKMWVQAGVYISIFLLIIFGINFPIFNHSIYAVLFCLLILCLSNKTYKILENKIINFLGNVAYGIYLYHPIAIIISIRISMNFSGLLQQIIIYIFSILLTILFSTNSYLLFEKKIFDLKSRFTKVYNVK